MQSKFEYQIFGLKFGFSNKDNYKSFIEGYRDFVEAETFDLELKFKCKVNCLNPLLISFYRQCEHELFDVKFLDKRLSTSYSINCIMR